MNHPQYVKSSSSEIITRETLLALINNAHSCHEERCQGPCSMKVKGDLDSDCRIVETESAEAMSDSDGEKIRG